MNPTRAGHARVGRLGAVLVALAGGAGAVEQLEYETLRTEGPFELRRYDAHVLAEVEVRGDVEEAGNRAFRPLYRFITGHNERQARIPMTAPVVQAPGSAGVWRVAFVMPADSALDRLPAPSDEQVRLRIASGGLVAAIRYSGIWSRERFEAHRRRLEEWIATNGWTAAGPPIWARYDPPFMPWFLRRNEVLIPIAEPQRAAAAR